jgi:hypothetical protein
MSTAFAAVVIAAMVGIVVYQIISGEVLDRSWKVWATRDEQPGRYWLGIAFQLLLVLIPIVILIYSFLGHRS